MYLSICLSLWDGTYIHTPWVWMDDVQQLHRANAALQVSLCVCGWRQHLYVSVCICLYLYLSLSVSVFVSVSMAYMYLDYRWMTSSNCNALMPPCRYLFFFFFFFSGKENLYMYLDYRWMTSSHFSFTFACAGICAGTSIYICTCICSGTSICIHAYVCIYMQGYVVYTYIHK